MPMSRGREIKVRYLRPINNKTVELDAMGCSPPASPA